MIDLTYQPAERRPLTSRDAHAARRLAAWLIARDVSANVVSLSSIGFAALAALCLVEVRTATSIGSRLLLLLAGLFVQLRLLANLLDGMIAVESKSASPLGELYNEVPDRVADVLILVAAGFASGAPALGYQAAVVALITAYLRALGNSVGVRGLFAGPMAKPQRMATITAACFYCAGAPVDWPGALGSGAAPAGIAVALAVIVAGGIVTSLRRLRLIAIELRGTR